MFKFNKVAFNCFLILFIFQNALLLTMELSETEATVPLEVQELWVSAIKAYITGKFMKVDEEKLAFYDYFDESITHCFSVKELHILFTTIKESCYEKSININDYFSEICSTNFRGYIYFIMNDLGIKSKEDMVEFLKSVVKSESRLEGESGCNQLAFLLNFYMKQFHSFTLTNQNIQISNDSLIQDVKRQVIRSKNRKKLAKSFEKGSADEVIRACKYQLYPEYPDNDRYVYFQRYVVQLIKYINDNCVIEYIDIYAGNN